MKKVKIFYNAELNELYIPSDSKSSYIVLLGVDYIWYYIGDL